MMSVPSYNGNNTWASGACWLTTQNPNSQATQYVGYESGSGYGERRGPFWALSMEGALALTFLVWFVRDIDTHSIHGLVSQSNALSIRIPWWGGVLISMLIVNNVSWPLILLSLKSRHFSFYSGGLFLLFFFSAAFWGRCGNSSTNTFHLLNWSVDGKHLRSLDTEGWPT